MPYSDTHGKALVALTLMELNAAQPVRAIMDVGAGAGAYFSVLGPLLPDAQFCAVEVWAPFVRLFELDTRYQKVVVGDARYLDFRTLGKFDVALFGDVLEHMAPVEASELVDRTLECCDCAVLSIPVGRFPQDEWLGNPWERHVKDDWSVEDIASSFQDLVAVKVDGPIAIAVMARHAQKREGLRQAFDRACKRWSEAAPVLGKVGAIDYIALIRALGTLLGAAAAETQRSIDLLTCFADRHRRCVDIGKLTKVERRWEMAV